jgi:hypothetical protein
VLNVLKSQTKCLSLLQQKCTTAMSNTPKSDTPVAMLWDFFGPNAAQTAEHHLIHLNEFASNKNITPVALELIPAPDRSVVSFVLPWALVQELRPLLNPHRGQIWKKSQNK